jgi:hypothetical protein
MEIDYCNRDDTKVYINSNIRGASNPSFSWYKDDQDNSKIGGGKTSCCILGDNTKKGVKGKQWLEGACTRFGGNLGDACASFRDCKNKQCRLRGTEKGIVSYGRCSPY